MFQEQLQPMPVPNIPGARTATLSQPTAAAAAVLAQIGSTILAQAAGVPTVAWSGSGVSIDYASCNGEIPKEVGAAGV
jgi:acetyl-CoA carboxylase/biotin carboxylase 1